MEMDVRALNALIPVFDFVGIVAFALSGVFEGIKRRIDPVGVFIVAFSTAFGGGMLRDILIDRRPFLLDRSRSLRCCYFHHLYGSAVHL